MLESKIQEQAEKMKKRNNPVDPGVFALTILLAEQIFETSKIELPKKKIRFLLESPDKVAFLRRQRKVGKRFLIPK